MRKKIEWTGERLETHIFDQNTLEHLHRYAVALNLVKDKIVLDIACGSGYGTNILSTYSKKVCGVDIDESSINNAKKVYNKINIEFKAGSAVAIPYKDNFFDIVVSFETIEHIKEHDEMLKEIKRVLKKDGILIISTPDKAFYSDARNFNNQFHIKELYEHEFKELLEKYFSNIKFLKQVSGYNSLMVKADGYIDFSASNGDYSKITDIKPFGPMYWIAIGSDSEILDHFKPGIFDGSNIWNNYLNNIYQSKTYKLAKFISAPYRIFKKLLVKNG